MAFLARPGAPRLLQGGRALLLGGLQAVLAAQGLPPMPGTTPGPGLPGPSELLPLRPFDPGGRDGRPPVAVRFRGEAVQESPDLWRIAHGAIERDGLLVLADSLEYHPASGELLAEGRIRVEGPGLRMRCERLAMDWNTRSGEAWKLELELPPSWTLRADAVRFTDLKHWVFQQVELSPCPQEQPGWSARLASLTLDLDAWATFTHARVKVGPVPVLYLPWAIYPAKAERSPGLLPPLLGFSSTLGATVGLSYFQPLGSGADLTFAPEYYGRQGLLWGGELRWAPEFTHQGSLEAQYIDQRRDGANRYRYILKELWQREDGWQVTAELNQASDALLDSDYGRGVSNLGATSFDSSIYVGKTFSLASVSFAASEQRTFFQPEDPFYQPDFPSSLRRQTLPSGRVLLHPIPLGAFYLDAGLRLDRFAYRLELGDDHTSVGDYAWQRGDLATRLHGRLGQWGPFRVDLQLGARFTRYDAGLRRSVFDPDSGSSGDSLSAAADAFRVDGEGLSRPFGSGRLQFTAPQFGRSFGTLSLLGYKGELKHVLEPYFAVTENSRFGEVGRTPHFDEVDARPGVSGTGVGERSLELGLRQHFLGRPGAGALFDDLLRWKVSIRYYFQPVLLPDGRLQKGWGSLDNEVHAEPSAQLRVSFRRSTELSEGGTDSSLSTDYRGRDGSSFSLALFSTGQNRFMVRQQGVRAGGIQHFWGDRLRLEFQSSYDVRGHRFVNTQAALAYVTPCLATRLRYSHVDTRIPGALSREDRLDLTLTLRGLGDLFTTGLEGLFR